MPVNRMSRSQRKARRRQIATMAKEGKSLTDICHTFSVSQETVRTACREFEILPPESNPSGEKRNNNPYYEVIAALINSKDSCRVIAERFGITYQRVSQIYHRCNKVGIPVVKRISKSDSAWVRASDLELDPDSEPKFDPEPAFESEPAARPGIDSVEDTSIDITDTSDDTGKQGAD